MGQKETDYLYHEREEGLLLKTLKRQYYDHIYAHKLDNLDELEKMFGCPMNHI